ncbi:MAG TPA: hypothetical protein VJV03_01395 [Pyrinomonadaceae bacterium]|nr:hypothetical protein [Pyrinomonadaceae bacterium]
MIIRILLIIMLVTSWSMAQSPASSSQPAAPAKQYFIAIFSKGPAWDEAKPANEQAGFREHSENLRRLRAEKKISIGGRYGDKGMVIVEAQNEADARALFVSDVMVEKKTFTLELNQFRPFYKGAIE